MEIGGPRPTPPEEGTRVPPPVPSRLKPAEATQIKASIQQLGKQIVAEKNNAIQYNLSLQLIGRHDGRPSREDIQAKVNELEAKIGDLRGQLAKLKTNPGASPKQLTQINTVVSLVNGELEVLEKQREHIAEHLKKQPPAGQASTTSDQTKASVQDFKKKGGIISFISRGLGRSKRAAGRTEEVVSQQPTDVGKTKKSGVLSRLFHRGKKAEPEPMFSRINVAPAGPVPVAPVAPRSPLELRVIESQSSQATFRYTVDAQVALFTDLRDYVKKTLRPDQLKLLDDFISNMKEVQAFEINAQASLRPLSDQALRSATNSPVTDKAVPIYQTLWGAKSQNFSNYMAAIDRIQLQQAPLLELLNGMDKTLRNKDRLYWALHRTESPFKTWVGERLKAPEYRQIERDAGDANARFSLKNAMLHDTNAATWYLQRATRIPLMLGDLVKDLPDGAAKNTITSVKQNCEAHNNANQLHLASDELRGYQALSQSDIEQMKPDDIIVILKAVTKRIPDLVNYETRGLVREVDLSGISSSELKRVQTTLKQVLADKINVIAELVSDGNEVDRKLRAMKQDLLQTQLIQLEGMRGSITYFETALDFPPEVTIANLNDLIVKMRAELDRR